MGAAFSFACVGLGSTAPCSFSAELRLALREGFRAGAREGGSAEPIRERRAGAIPVRPLVRRPAIIQALSEIHGPGVPKSNDFGTLKFGHVTLYFSVKIPAYSGDVFGTPAFASL